MLHNITSNSVIALVSMSSVSFDFSSRLTSLQHLSVDYNQLTELPVEICALLRLEEFRAASNQLTSLPLEFGFLVNLEKLYLQKNKIRELPEVKLNSFVENISIKTTDNTTNQNGDTGKQQIIY